MRTLFQSCAHTPGKRSLLVSLAVHGLLLGALVVVPLIGYAALPEARLVSYLPEPALTVAPPPPAPSAATPPPSKEIQDVVLPSDQLIMPKEVPAGIPIEVDEPPSVIGALAGESGPSVAVPSGTTGIAGIPSGLQAPALPEPPRPEPAENTPAPQHVRVSEGIVLSKVIRKVHPRYPPLAKKARIDGRVLLDITIDEQGNVFEIQVTDGRALLIQAAKDAVAQWKFSPTLLNGQPVKVKARISIVFTLN